jgi:hypothetical protein
MNLKNLLYCTDLCEIVYNFINIIDIKVIYTKIF